jgi:hypothetical protein
MWHPYDATAEPKNWEIVMSRMSMPVGRRDRSTRPALVVIKIVYLDDDGKDLKTTWAVVTDTSPPEFKSKEFSNPEEAFACLENLMNSPTPS